MFGDNHRKNQIANIANKRKVFNIQVTQFYLLPTQSVLFLLIAYFCIDGL